MPTLRPFRALRYDQTEVGDLSAVISPPYDVISAELQSELAARHPRNAVYLDLPPRQAGDTADARYRRAAAAFVAWRSDGTLRKDPRPSIYVYEQRFRVGGTAEERTQRGFYARLTLEAFGPGSSVRPHERTLGGPRADRMALLTATGANFSPIVGLYRSPATETAPLLTAMTAGQPIEDVTDTDGVRHRLWMVEAGARGDGGPVDQLIALAEATPIVIADGHHRYATALEYRMARGERRACTEDPPYETILALLYDLAATELTILPTHRVVSGDPKGEALLIALRRHFEVTEIASSEALVAAFPEAPSGEVSMGPRIGVWSGGRAAILRPRAGALDAVLDRLATPAVRGLPVSLVEAVLSEVYGLDAAAIADGDRVTYVKGARHALEAAGQLDGTAFLLDPTSADDVLRVAQAGELMPQKSTYFSPKPATGLLYAPGEW